mgnify:CR=1 FL=1
MDGKTQSFKNSFFWDVRGYSEQKINAEFRRKKPAVFSRSSSLLGGFFQIVSALTIAEV